MAIETVPIHRGQWIDLVLRMDIPTQRKAVAFALSRFANPDGTRVFPGREKVADMAKLHETNARKHVRALETVGLLKMVKRGGGRGGATNEYRLSRPADITTLPLWLDPEMNRVESGGDGPVKYRVSAPGETGERDQEQRASAPGISVDNSADVSVDNSETPGAGALHSGPADDETPGVSAGNTGRFVQEYRALTLPDQPNTNPRPTQHPAGLRKATTSLALVPPVHNDDETTTESGPDRPPADNEFETARVVLAALPRPAADAWRHTARRALEADAIPLSRRAVEIRAAQLATTPTDHATNGVA